MPPLEFRQVYHAFHVGDRMAATGRTHRPLPSQGGLAPPALWYGIGKKGHPGVCLQRV